jgi:GGDEF domain-containing protein
VVDLSPRKRAKGLKILEIFTQDQIDESGFGDSDLGAFLRMQTDILRHHENSGLHDKTGIMNAKRFVQFLELVIQRWDFEKEAGEDEQREVPKDLFLVFMDLDNFKELNNQLSYQGADEVLKEFALFIQEYTDECQGVASYWAGDEYVIFAPTQGSADDFPIR